MPAPEPTPKPPSVSRNSLVLMIGFAVTCGCMVLSDFAVIHVLGPAAHGRVTAALALAMGGALLCDLGLASKGGVKTIAAMRAAGTSGQGRVIGRMLLTLLVTGLVAAAVVGAASGVIAGWLGVPAFAVRQASIWLFAGAGIRACAMVFIGAERMIFVAVIGALAEGSRLIWVLLCGWLELGESALYAGWSVTWLASMLVCMACVAVLLATLQVRLVWWPVDVRKAAGQVRESLVFFPPLLTNQALGPVLYLTVGLTLAWRKDTQFFAEETISLLKVTFTLAMVLGIASQAIATSLFPALTRRVTLNQAYSLRKTMKKAVKLIGLLGCAVYLFYAAIGRWILVLYEPNPDLPLYSDLGVGMLLAFTVAVCFDCVRLQADQVLMVLGRARHVVTGELTKLVMLVPGVAVLTCYFLEVRSVPVVALFVCLLAMCFAIHRLWLAYRVVRRVTERDLYDS